MGAEILPSWKHRSLLSNIGSCGFTFKYRGLELPFFLHHHNCGAHPLVATERTVELAIADHWLNHRAPREVIEIGAVTPYYWPHRVGRVIDPYDPHPLVTDRASIEDIDLSAGAVLSISTFEHIGTGDYNLRKDDALFVRSFQRLFEQSSQFLVTLPLGYNPAADEFVLSSAACSQARASLFARQMDPPFWQHIELPRPGIWKYGKHRADAVLILERSNYTV